MNIDNVKQDGNIYYRIAGSNYEKQDIEFINKIEEITGDNFFEKKENFSSTYIEYSNNFCICGHECPSNITYLIEHEPSRKKIAVGSVCIEKLWSGYINNLDMFKKNGACKNCKNVLRRGRDLKNYNYNCEKRCYSCILNLEGSILIKKKQVQEKEKEIENLERVYRLPQNQELIDREKKLRERERKCQELELELREKLNILNHQVKKQEKRVYLNIPFRDKDKAKENGARWDNDRKSWYAPDKSYTELIEFYS